MKQIIKCKICHIEMIKTPLFEVTGNICSSECINKSEGKTGNVLIVDNEKLKDKYWFIK